ncbi:MAG: hypothetical protein LBI26_01095 [Holosporales bacterium]|jgi:hypothetical protein|nr:hypothetical protein [Holosporales bacterium]
MPTNFYILIFIPTALIMWGRGESTVHRCGGDSKSVRKKNDRNFDKLNTCVGDGHNDNNW